MLCSFIINYATAISVHCDRKEHQSTKSEYRCGHLVSFIKGKHVYMTRWVKFLENTLRRLSSSFLFITVFLSSRLIVPRRTSGINVYKNFDAKARLTEISVNDMIGLKNISMTPTKTSAEISSSMSFITFLSHLSHSGDLLLWVGVRRRASCVNIFLSRTTRPILTKFDM